MKKGILAAAALTGLLLPTASSRASRTSVEPRPWGSKALEALINTYESLDPVAATALRRAAALEPLTIDTYGTVADLDGDGGRDVLVYHYELTDAPVGVTFFYSGTLDVTVVSGRTGEELWTRQLTFVDGWAGVGSFRSGPKGKGGLLASTLSAASIGWTYELTALDGQGNEVWTRTLPSTYNFTLSWTLFLPAQVATDALIALDRVDGVGGPTEDLLIARADYVRSWTADIRHIRVKVGVIDGSDGTLTEFPSEFTTDRLPSISHTGDLNGDGAEDYLLARRQASGKEWVVESHDVSDSEIIWRWRGVLGSGVWLSHAPDLTGDGVMDVALTYDRGQHNYFAFLNGRSGSYLFEGQGIFPYAAGDIDGDGATDIGAYDFYDTKSATGHRYLAYASTGNLLYSKIHAFSMEGCQKGCFSFGFLLNAGDVDNDSIRDAHTDIRITSSGSSLDANRSATFTTSGRDGSKIAGKHLIPLKGSVDGSGDDSALVSRSGDRLRLEVHDGVTPRVLWESTISLAGPTRLADSFAPYGAADDLTGDGCDDLLVLVKGEADFALVLLDGTDGAMVWGHSLIGDSAPKVVNGKESPSRCASH